MPGPHIGLCSGREHWTKPRLAPSSAPPSWDEQPPSRRARRRTVPQRVREQWFLLPNEHGRVGEALPSLPLFILYVCPQRRQGPLRFFSFPGSHAPLGARVVSDRRRSCTCPDRGREWAR